jgi:predicted nucleic acid-binding protein
MKAVVNATPLIALSLVHKIMLLDELFDEVYVPVSVYNEVVVRGASRPGSMLVQQAQWLKIQLPQQSSPIPASLMGLDVGEQDVILLGQEVHADWLLLDERLGRRIAQAMGFQVKGTLGILLVAYQLGLLTKQEAEHDVEVLSKSSVRLSPRLTEWFKAQLESTPEL